MSGRSSRLSRRSRSLKRRDDGFTLIEVVIAFGLLAVVMASAIPVLVAMLRTTAITKANTQAKNLAQERIEQMRDLRFHVDRQNGRFLDLLDIYYTNANAAGTTTVVTTGGGPLTGKHVTSGATAGEPAVPFYRVTTGPIPGATGFSQTIDSQFLAPDGTALTPATTYDSQTVGADLAPSLMLGVTVITNWTYGGKVKTFRTYTRMTDGRPQLPAIQSQSRAVAVDITSSAADGSTLELQGGVARLDGAQSSGSSVAGYVSGAVATRTGVPAVTGQTVQFALPSQAATTTGTSSTVNPGSCAWYAFGKTATANTSPGGDVSAGLPDAPANVAAGTPPNVLTGSILANSGGGCGAMSYDNLAGGGIARPGSDVVGFEMGAAPYVKAPDISGSGASISGSGYVTSNAITSVPQQTRSGAAATMDTASTVVLFPGNTESGGRGLVSARLTSASVDCVSGVGAADGTIVGKYTLQLGWWGKGTADAVAKWHTATWNYDSGTGATPVLAGGSDAWDPANTVLGNGTKLSQLVTSSGGAPNAVATGATSGVRGFASGIFTLTTTPTLTNETSTGFSAINVQLGELTCVADDQR